MTTTYKTFLDICPPELIKEHRVADRLIRLITPSGKISTVYFRPLEEADKFRSMNLSGFYIDEANQVSEAAFLLLQGRLRGGGIRKGIITTNPKGHDWIYKWFVRKDHIKTVDFRDAFHLIMAPSTENTHLPEGYISSLMASWTDDQIARDIQGSFDSFEGQIYREFNRQVHVVRPFRIPQSWKRYIRIDHGYRNPCAVLFSAVSPEGEVFVYREFYEREWLIKEIINGNKKEEKYGIASMYNESTNFVDCKIDPSTKARRGVKGTSDFDEYAIHWPKDLPPLQLARNAVEVGIDRVKQYLKVNPKTNKPLLYIFSTCTNLIEEISTYRYQELGSGEHGKKNEKEEPIKVDDHACDALRYLIIDLPAPYTPERDESERLKKYSNIEIQFQDEIANFRKPKEPKDPFNDGI